MPAANKRSLVTLGDFFRLAEQRFRMARLAYGHGTGNARDEAAFLVLEALRLPSTTSIPGSRSDHQA
jgi:ribosomal protein L3 glutamine methyltransferase